jgi:transposase
VDTQVIGDNAPKEVQMKRKKRREFTKEFKREAVVLVNKSDQPLSKTARELGLGSSTLRDWVQRAEIDAGNGPPGALTTAEKQELVQLRKDVKRLTMEREILKKATVFFAKES